MTNKKLFALSLTFALFLQRFQLAYFKSIDHFRMENNETEGVAEALNCLRKYSTIHFKEMAAVRFNVIREQHLDETRNEQIFLQTSNEKFPNPITLTTFASLDNDPKNYLIFLSSKGLAKLRDTSLPNVHDESFLYVFFEQNDASISLKNIYSIFTPVFGQNVLILMMTSRRSREWSIFRVVLRQCGLNSEQYSTIKVSQCRADVFIVLPLMPMESADESCPLQVAGRDDPPFAYYDRVRGFHNGIEYHFVRLFAERMRIPIEFTYFNNTTAEYIKNRFTQQKSTANAKQNTYIRQANNNHLNLYLVCFNFQKKHQLSGLSHRRIQTNITRPVRNIHRVHAR